MGKQKASIRNKTNTINKVKDLSKTHQNVEASTVDELLFRHACKQAYSHIKEPHCKICGDTIKHGGLNKISDGTHLCDTCLCIQKNM